MKFAVIGGHMAPAFGFIAHMPQKVEVVYIGREHVFEGDSGKSLEFLMAKEFGARFIPFTTGRVQRVLTPHTLPSLLQIPKGFYHAFRLLQKEQPDIVVGFGGYVSVPLGIAAWVLGIPLVIHESTLQAGMANKLLAPFAKRICISWESSRTFFPGKKTVLTGNPLLPFAAKLSPGLLPKSTEKLPLVVVTGGSGGSHVVNTLLLGILPELLKETLVVHLTGDAQEFNDYDVLEQKKKNLSPQLRDRYGVHKFIDPKEINALFHMADVVVGRSGINTVTALLVLRKKAILIPLRFGQKKEQLKNAQLLESEKLGVILDEAALSPQMLLTRIKNLLHKKVVSPNWEIPVVPDGGKNLMKEVMACLPAQHNEN